MSQVTLDPATTTPVPAPEGSAAAWDAGDVRVLVVEDEIRQAAALKRGLEAEGFAVDVAANGTDGLWLATEQPYDVIVLDVMLPGLNGYRVCAELRAREIWTPVLMLTAKDGELDEAEALWQAAEVNERSMIGLFPMKAFELHRTHARLAAAAGRAEEAAAAARAALEAAASTSSNARFHRTLGLVPGDAPGLAEMQELAVQG